MQVPWLFNRAWFSIAVRVEQHNFDSRKPLPHDLAQFLGIEVGQAAIEKDYLPETALQMDQGFGSSAGLFEVAGGRT